MSSVTLGYWGIRGLAQPIRFLLEYLGLPYTDHKYSDPAVWGADKADFLKTDPLANIPYLKDGDRVVFESQAIPLYLVHKANRSELLGTGNADE
jgi:glutathione S-transferase